MPLLTTFGLSIVIGNVLLKIFSPDVQSLDPGALGTASWRITAEPVDRRLRRARSSAIAVVVLGGLQLFLTRTEAGRERARDRRRTRTPRS